MYTAVTHRILDHFWQQTSSWSAINFGNNLLHLHKYLMANECFFRLNQTLISNLNASHSSFNIWFHFPLPELTIPGDRCNLYWVLLRRNLVLYLKVASLLRSWSYKMPSLCLLATYTTYCWVGRGYQSDDAEKLLLVRPRYCLPISEVLVLNVLWHPPEGRREKDSDWGVKAQTLRSNWAQGNCLLFHNSKIPNINKENIFSDTWTAFALSFHFLLCISVFHLTSFGIIRMKIQ